MKIGIVAFSTAGCHTAKAVADGLSDAETELFAKTVSDTLGIRLITGSLRQWTKEAFVKYDAIVFVGAVGIAVREIAPFVKSKMTDPAVVAVDEKGRFSVPVLSGHIGGANGLAVRIAGVIGAIPVVTTASDINGKIAIDVFAVKNYLTITSLSAAKEVEALILDGKPVGFVSDFPVLGRIPPELSGDASSRAGVYIGYLDRYPFPLTLHLVPRNIVVGIGCRLGTSKQDIEEMFCMALDKANVSADRVRAFASIDLKKDEKGLLDFASDRRRPITFYSADELNSVDGDFSSSGFVKTVTSVDCVCERSAVKESRNGRLILKKTSGNGVTIAIAEEDYSVDFSR